MVDKTCGALGLPQSTLFRYLDGLCACGLLVKLSRGRYKPSPTLLHYTELWSSNSVLAELAQPILADLADAFSTTVHLGILEEDMVTYLFKFSSSTDEIFTQEGGQLEAYCSGIGKVLLAALPEEELLDYLSTGPFPRLTPRTLTEPRLIHNEISRTARRGYAIDAGEVAETLYCIAAPVKDRFGQVIAAISVSSLVPAIPQRGPKKQIKAIREAADEISMRLGHRPPN